MSDVVPPTQVRPFHLAGYRGEALAGAEAAVHTRLLPDPMARALEGRVLRKSNARRTARVSWDGVGPVLLKVHRSKSWRERLLSLVRSGRARDEWDAARYLRGIGAPVPEPLAVGDRRRFGVLDTSFFAARFLESLVPVHDALPAQSRDQRSLMHERLAQLIRVLHERGFDHRDLHSGNLLAGPGPGDRCRLVVTDLHRCRWGGVLSRAERVRGVAQWVHSLRDELQGDALASWLDAYLGPEERSERSRWHADVQRRVERFEHVRLGSRGKRCLKESTVYTRSVGAGWGGRRRTLSQPDLEAALEAHADALSRNDERVAKRGRRGVVTRHGAYVVKERLAPGLMARIRDALFPRRHADGYRNAHKLEVRDIGTATPLAYVRRSGRSYTVFADLSALPRLDHLARRLFAEDRAGEGLALLEASARWVGQLHARGVYHGDLKGVNVLVAQESDSFRFHLIDTDHCRFFPEGVDRRRRIKNLAQLSASIPESVTHADRARWYDLYESERSSQAGEQRAVSAEQAALCREVDALMAEKIVVVDEPIE